MTKDCKTGYKLHLQRLIFSGGEVTRSVKFPLKTIHDSSAPLKECFENKIIADDLKLRGGINLPDYQQNPNNYGLAQFWIDSLRAGVIWQPTASKLTDFVRRYFKEPSKGDEIFAKAARVNTKLRFFEKETFVETIILKGPKRSGGSSGGFRNELIGTVKMEYKEGKNKLSPQAQPVIDQILNDFYDQNGKLKLDANKQNEYWLKEFDIDKSLLEKEQSGAANKELAKLTFFIIPQLVNLDKELTPSQLLEQRKSLFLNPDADSLIEDGKLAELLGLKNNFNALSHYLNYAFQLLYSDKTDEIFQAFTERAPTIAPQEKEVKEALEFLAHKAKKLGSPQTGRGWHEYRSVFGGKIQSWFSNYQRREKELEKQTQKLQQGIKNAQILIDERVRDDSLLKQEAQAVTDLLNQISHVLGKNTDNLQESKEYEVFLDLLAQARRELNFFYQKYLKEEDDETAINKHKELKYFYSAVYKPMTFFAQKRLEQNEKTLRKTIAIIEEGLQIAYRFLDDNQANFDPSSTFEKVKRKNETPEFLYRRSLQRIWGRLKDKRINSAEFRQKYSQILKKALEDESRWNKICADPNRYCFYKSPYAKGTSTEIALKSAEFLAEFRSLVEDLYGFAVSLKDTSIFDNEGQLQDKNELLKTLLADLVRFSTKERFDIAGMDLSQFEKAQKYLELLNRDKLDKNEAAYFYQSLIFSELRGAITVFTNKKYKSRYVLQLMRSPNKFPLFYYSRIKALDAKALKLNRKDIRGQDLLSQNPHYYCIASSQKVEPAKKVQSSPFLRLLRKGTEIVGLEEADHKYLLKISTSPYQLQFLERFVSPIGDWKKVDITLSEWSFIVEKNYAVDWNRKTKQPTFTQNGETKLFVSIPFQISAEKLKEEAGLTNLSAEHLAHPILGIDVGEYGVGWVLAKFSDGIADILRRGFIRDRNIAAIQDNFASIQARAKKGVFNASSNTVAQVRENAIGAVRNQIHDILTQETASVVYEYSISNFETGGGRVTRVYNSVKRADVYPETGADKLEHAHVWGDKYANPGTHLSAYASSYTCASCARSIYKFNQKEIGQARIIAREGNILTIETPKGKVCGYGRDKKFREGYHFKNSKEGFKEFMKLVKDFGRPPVSTRSETLSRFYAHLSKKQLDQFAQQRGNSAIFVCPFVDCHNVADADIQAAFMMAIRGYLNWSEQVKTDEKEKKDFLGKTLEFLHSLKNRHQLSKEFSVSADVS
jgi:hypothetical protein